MFRKSFFFCENNLKNKKALQQMPKGWKLSGSPDCNIDRTFISTFYFPHKATKANQIIHIHRNPIYLAREYKQMIDSGEVKSQSELAKLKGVSRARVTQILNLLKLDIDIIIKLEQIGDPMYERIFSERKLRNANKQNN